VITDGAIYARGSRLEAPPGLAGIRCRLQKPDAFVWVALLDPDEDELSALGTEFALDERVLEDAVKAQRRPKLERYGSTLSLVIKTVTFRVDDERVEVGDIVLFAGSDFLIAVAHGQRAALDRATELLDRGLDQLSGPDAAMYAIVAGVVAAYQPAVEAVAEDIGEVEAIVFSNQRVNPVQRIYKLHSDVLEFRRAIAPLAPAFDQLATEDLPHITSELHAYFRDTAEHLVRVGEQLDAFRDLLNGVLQANLTQVSVRQNEDMRRISAWVAMFAVPTLVTGIYGMNFDHMPELDSRFAYPASLLVIGSVCAALYWRFRRSGWL
jgi:magnesium transporter